MIAIAAEDLINKRVHLILVLLKKKKVIVLYRMYVVQDFYAREEREGPFLLANNAQQARTAAMCARSRDDVRAEVYFPKVPSKGNQTINLSAESL